MIVCSFVSTATYSSLDASTSGNCAQLTEARTFRLNYLRGERSIHSKSPSLPTTSHEYCLPRSAPNWLEWVETGKILSRGDCDAPRSGTADGISDAAPSTRVVSDFIGEGSWVAAGFPRGGGVACAGKRPTLSLVDPPCSMECNKSCGARPSRLLFLVFAFLAGKPPTPGKKKNFGGRGRLILAARPTPSQSQGRIPAGNVRAAGTKT